MRKLLVEEDGARLRSIDVVAHGQCPGDDAVVAIEMLYERTD